ncbi:MAG: hypothetical protein ABI068_04975 [Ktedonobacterales bacterium]
MAFSLEATQQQQTAEQAPTPAYLKWQRILLAACILLAPLSISLYVVS